MSKIFRSRKFTKGEVAKRLNPKTEMQTLSALHDKLIQKEDYEGAAVVNERLRELMRGNREAS